LHGSMNMHEARSAIQQATRRYAKRQITWFRRENGVNWCSGFGDDPQVQTQALKWIQGQGLDPGRGAQITGV
jgi:tRNA dimethylallyltransferase